MAGLNMIQKDPALEKVYEYNKNRYQHFKITPKAGRIGFIYMVLIPSALGYVLWRTDGKYDFRAKMRGDTIVEW